MDVQANFIKFLWYLHVFVIICEICANWSIGALLSGEALRYGCSGECSSRAAAWGLRCWWLVHPKIICTLEIQHGYQKYCNGTCKRYLLSTYWLFWFSLHIYVKFQGGVLGFLYKSSMLEPKNNSTIEAQTSFGSKGYDPREVHCDSLKAGVTWISWFWDGSFDLLMGNL